MEVFKTVNALNRAAAEFICSVAFKAIKARGRFVIAMDGGETPLKIYSLLTKRPFRKLIDWDKTFIFWTDERCVPLNDSRNNAHTAKKILFNHIDIPENNIHTIPVNFSPTIAASKYEKELTSFFGSGPKRFDLILLGLGENGHTASLFPGTNVLQEQAVGIRTVYVEEEQLFRITMTAPLINQARHILFLVAGKRKAEILKRVTTSSGKVKTYPAQLIKPINGELNWFVDSKAASLLK